MRTLSGWAMHHKLNHWAFILFAMAGLACFVGAGYMVSQYWTGPYWDVYTNKGNIMYHDSMCFLFAAMFACLGVIAVLRGLYWAERFGGR